MRCLLTLLLACTTLTTSESTVEIELPVTVTGVNHPDDLGILITMDGRRVLLPSIADTHLWKGSATGSATSDSIALRDNRYCQGLVAVDLADLQAETPLDNAVFHCRVTRVEKPGQPGRIRLHRMLVPWGEDASWKVPTKGTVVWDGLKPGRDFASEPFASIDLPKIDTGLIIEVPGVGEALAQWRSGSWAAHGMLLLYDGTGVQIHIATREAVRKRKDFTIDAAITATVGCDGNLLRRLLGDPARFVSARLGLTALTEPTAGTRLTVDGTPIDGLAPDCTAAVRAAVGNSDIKLRLGAEAGTLQFAGPGDSKRRPSLVVTLRSQASPDLFPIVTRIRNGVFATPRDGHLWYGDQRLRLWGTLGSGSVERARKMGFNAYRFWGKPERFYSAESAARGEFAPSVQEDGSPLDVFDRTIARFRALDMFIMDTSLMQNAYSKEIMPGVVADGSFISDGEDWPAWRDAVRAMKHFGAAQPALVLFDERMQRIRMRNASNILNHVNPYTGRAYGTEEAVAIWELANEQWVVGRLVGGDLDRLGPYFSERLRLRWVDWLRTRHHDDAGLALAWDAHEGTLASGDIPLPKPGKQQDRRRLDDWARFLLALSAEWQTRFVTHCRSQAPAGKGIAVAPFSNDTQYRPDLTWTYDNSRCEVQNFGMYFWNMGSQLTVPPSLYVMDSTTTEGRITAIYETNRGRPSAYRSEYPFILASFAAWQDWDAVFFHYWGGSPDGTPDERWLTTSMMPPHSDHFWNAVHHSNDPVMCASMAAAGRAFLHRAIVPAPDPAIVHVGDQAILRRGTVAVGSTAFARGARLRFEPGSDTDIRVDNEVQPEPGKAVASGDQILWDWPNGRLVVDTPCAKFLVGRPAAHRFRDGITVSGFTLPFTAFAVVSADGRPLADGCTKAWISATADARNTGFAMDLEHNLDGPVNQAKAIRAPGRAPVIVERPGWTLSFPVRLEGRFTAFDFALRPQEPVLLAGPTLRWRDREMWLGVLDISSRGELVEPEQDVVAAFQISAPLNADEPATDVAYAAIPHPLPGVSWGDNHNQALRTVRDTPFGSGRTESIGTRQDDERKVLVREVEYRGGTADIEVRFRAGRQQAVVVTFTRPPTWDAALADAEREWGKPSEIKLGSQFEGSYARWQTADINVALEETQGIMVMRWESKR